MLGEFFFFDFRRVFKTRTSFDPMANGFDLIVRKLGAFLGHLAFVGQLVDEAVLGFTGLEYLTILSAVHERFRSGEIEFPLTFVRIVTVRAMLV